MPRSTLSIVLALVLFVGFATTAKADVTGSFDLHISLEPEDNDAEAVLINFDLQSRLQVAITLSGLTFGFDLGFGVTGVEFAVLTLNTNLGALAVDDTFAFAEPFGCTEWSGLANSNTAAAAGTTCDPTEIFPIGDSDGDSATPADRAVGFVKKRVEMSLNIAGITLTNLAIFEDVDFPDINNSGTHEHDHWGNAGTQPHYYVGFTDSIVDNQTPTFGFGDVISLSGQTVSGITVTGTTGFCASGTNTIKKYSWTYEVNKACTAAFGDDTGPAAEDELESGKKTPVLFEFEKLSIGGIEIGGVIIDVSTTWKPAEANGFDTTITASFSVLDLADVTVKMSSSNITALSLDTITVDIFTGNLSLTLTDTGGDLTIDKTVAVLSVVLNPNQNPASLTIELTVAGGLTDAVFTLGIGKGALFLDVITTFSGTAGDVAWDSTEFVLGVDMGNGFTLSADFTYGTGGLAPASITLGILF